MVSLDRLMAGTRKVDRKRLTVREARAVLEEAEVDRMFPDEVVNKEAVRVTENDGWVCGGHGEHGTKLAEWIELGGWTRLGV